MKSSNLRTRGTSFDPYRPATSRDIPRHPATSRDIRSLRTSEPTSKPSNSSNLRTYPFLLSFSLSPSFFLSSFVFTPVCIRRISGWHIFDRYLLDGHLFDWHFDCALYVSSYIRLCQQGDPYSFLFGSPASTLRSLRTRATLRALLRTAVALTLMSVVHIEYIWFWQ